MTSRHRAAADENTAMTVVVYRGRWFWQRDYFYSEEPIEATVGQGVLVVVVEGEAHSYNRYDWTRVVSKKVMSRARV